MPLAGLRWEGDLWRRRVVGAEGRGVSGLSTVLDRRDTMNSGVGEEGVSVVDWLVVAASGTLAPVSATSGVDAPSVAAICDPEASIPGLGTCSVAFLCSFMENFFCGTVVFAGNVGNLNRGICLFEFSSFRDFHVLCGGGGPGVICCSFSVSAAPSASCFCSNGSGRALSSACFRARSSDNGTRRKGSLEFAFGGIGVAFSSEGFGDWVVAWVSRRYCGRVRANRQILQIHFGDCCANIAPNSFDTRKETTVCRYLYPQEVTRRR